ncbi:MAG: tetratricopeptide repeat protein [Myxococcota bacterium]
MPTVSRSSWSRSLAIIAVLMLFPLAGCGGAPQTTEDAYYVQSLRLRITKARAAIEETRFTIARSRGAPYLPELYVRLAELLSEEASYHYRVAVERQQGSREGLHVPQVRLLKEQAIEVYQRILSDYPDTDLAPRVLFNIAQEHRELGNFDDMRSILGQLVERGRSRFLQQALILLGDYHFDRSELSEAEGYYLQVARGPRTRLSALSRYKLAWVAVNRGDCEQALGHFHRAIEIGREVADAEDLLAKVALERERNSSEASAEDQAEDREEEPLDESRLAQLTEVDERDLESLGGDYAIDVRRAAVTDLAYCYTQEREPELAVAFLREWSYDRATYVAGLARMARRLGTVEEGAGLLHVLRELLRLGPINLDRLEDARSMHTVLRSINSYEDLGVDIEHIVRVLRVYGSLVGVPSAEKESLKEEFEVYVRDLLTRAQAKMDGLGEGEQADFARSLGDGYRAYLAHFHESASSLDMMLNAAEVASVAKRYAYAAELSLRAADLLPERSARRRDALYDAVVRLQEVLRESDGDDIAARALARNGLLRAGRELLRFPVESDNERLVKFGIALAYLDSGRYVEAVDYLTAVAYEFPQSSEGDAAIRLVLDSFSDLSDFGALADAARRFSAEEGPASPALRGQIQPMLAATEQRMLDEVSLEAAGEEGGDLSVLVDFAERNQGTELGERALSNAFLAARAMGDTDKVYALGAQISEAYPNSEQLPGMLATIGQTAVARFEIDRAVEFLRQAAAAGHPQRSVLLGVVGQLQEQTGDLAGAIATYQETLALEQTPAAQATPLARLASVLERQGDPSMLLSSLAPFLHAATPEVLVRIGLAKLALGRTDEAEMDLQSALSAGATPEVRARAYFGSAEVLRSAVEAYPEITDIMLLEEFVTVVDVVQQAYLEAVREQDSDYSSMALLRLASMVRTAAAKIRRFSPPAELGEARAQVEAALGQRAQSLEQTAEEAVQACSRQAWQMRSFGPTARLCLGGDQPNSVLPEFDRVSRSTAGSPNIPDALRARVARNPEDVEALVEMGTLLLDAGAPHLARTALTSANQHGGGPTEANLLGVANHQIGDFGAALRAFAFAADANLEVGRQNLATLLRQLGLSDAATVALETFSEGRAGGRRIGAAP